MLERRPCRPAGRARACTRRDHAFIRTITSPLTVLGDAHLPGLQGAAGSWWNNSTPAVLKIESFWSAATG